MSVRITGVKAVQSRLRGSSARLRPLVSSVVQKVTREVEADAKALAPVDTGNLQNSINSTVLSSFGSSVVGQVVPAANYAIYQELGTSKMAAQPFLFPALERHTPEFLAAVKGAARAAL